ncbi:type III-B CRISPR module RAMP protein Cmr4 [Staphylospora marina]|uniref:type III-B CRISPR module RAMP protein Cmr4 n=1 Tax=Staphylospora marina TaxID=2490858 RepID=UPI000F5BBBD6|nr:type III-B CRISPR module RAMP protein Cmr4 [Staphylospora marina]
MQATVMGLLAETAVHPGSGRQDGLLDLPVIREAVTEYPLIPGSALKGALREKLVLEHGDVKNPPAWIDQIFGTKEEAGGVGITDARLLLLPVRSLSGHYRWVTCPYALERLQRDLSLTGVSLRIPEVDIPREQAITARPESEAVFLEEFTYIPEQDEPLIREIIGCIAPLIRHDSVRKRLPGQLVLLNNDEFSHFARFSLPIVTKNQLDLETKTSRNVWNEETIPPDTLMYSLLIPRPGREDSLKKLTEELARNPYVQIGGNETTGQGWMSASLPKGWDAA